MDGSSLASSGPGAVGWGVLRLVQRWPADEGATGSTQAWPDQSPPARLEPRHLVLVPPLGATFDRRAATIALRQVLVEWRLAAGTAERLAEGSLEWSQMQAQVAALRSAYHRLFVELRRAIGA